MVWLEMMTMVMKTYLDCYSCDLWTRNMSIIVRLLEIRPYGRPTQSGSAFHQEPQEMVCMPEVEKHCSRTLPATLTSRFQSY